MLLHYQVAMLCCLVIQAGAQFAHFPATGGGREASRIPSKASPQISIPQPKPPSPSRPSLPTRNPVSQKETQVDYDDYDYDIPVLRKPIPRNLGRAIVNSRVQSVDKKIPRKPVERERPRLQPQIQSSISGRVKSQPNRGVPQKIQVETRRPFIPEFKQQAAPFTQFQPRIEQSREEENTPVFTDTTQAHRLVPAVRPAPVQRQQVEQQRLEPQRQEQPLQTQPVFDSLFSNTVVAPQQGEQGEGVYFSYTATLGY